MEFRTEPVTFFFTRFLLEGLPVRHIGHKSIGSLPHSTQVLLISENNTQYNLDSDWHICSDLPHPAYPWAA